VSHQFKYVKIHDFDPFLPAVIKVFLNFCMWIHHMEPVPDEQLRLFVLQV